MSTPKPPIDRFRDNLDYLCKNLLLYLKDATKNGYTHLNPILLEAAIYGLNNGKTNEELMIAYTALSIDYWIMIEAKQRGFFIDNMTEVFGGMAKLISREHSILLFDGISPISNQPYIGKEKELDLWNTFGGLCRTTIRHRELNPNRFDQEVIKKYKELKATEQNPDPIFNVDWDFIKKVWYPNGIPK